jgi:hypothetical protein
VIGPECDLGGELVNCAGDLKDLFFVGNEFLKGVFIVKTIFLQLLSVFFEASFVIVQPLEPFQFLADLETEAIEFIFVKWVSHVSVIVIWHHLPDVRKMV